MKNGIEFQPESVMPKTEQQVKTQPHIKKAESNAEEGGSGVEEAVCEIAEVSQNMDGNQWQKRIPRLIAKSFHIPSLLSEVNVL